MLAKMYKWPVLCLIVLGAVDLIREVAALKKGDVGVCETKISTRTTKKVTYTKFINKMCGKRKCIAKASRTQPFVVTRLQQICCIGYQYRAESDDCAPLCTTGCHGGRCVAPDTCQCEFPSYLDPDHRNICLQPVCEPSCLNAVCTPNKTCQCHAEHQAFNATHCYKCEPGFSISTDFTCKPICDPPCVNGECTAPDVCTCNVGYKNNGNHCEPACSCVNGTCVAPDTCTCLDGYSPINNSHCAPVCNNCTGHCVSPGVCECFEGYVSVEESCRPICHSTCENGYCSGPDQCSCNEGFVEDETSGACVKPDYSAGTYRLKGPGVGRCLQLVV